MVVTRIAPSPTGFVHLGNAVNFLLTDWVARSQPGSRVHLRIDDMGLPQVRDEYLADIFWAVDWLEIGVTDGPSGVAEFRAEYRQADRIEDYRAAMMPLIHSATAYVCECSRTTLARRQPGTADPCANADLPLRPGATALRFRTAGELSPDTNAAVARIGVPAGAVRAGMGDFIVWRRDDLPAYQLVSVIEDDRHAVDTVVRGADLRLSSAAQLMVAQPLGISRLSRARLLHHDLLVDGSGAKMSKRDNADALRIIAQSAGGRQRVWEAATSIAERVGLPRPTQ